MAISQLDQYVQSTLKWVLLITLTIVPLTWTATTSELFEFPKMLVVYLATVVIAGLWIARCIIAQRLIFQRTYLDIPLFLFLASQIIATFLSLDPRTSLWGYYSRFHGGLASTISYLVLYYATVSNLGKGLVKWLIGAVLAGGLIGSVYAFPEHFGHSPSCLKVTGDFNAVCWVQDVQTRVFGTFGQPNWLAAYIITIIFIPLAYGVSSLKDQVSSQKNKYVPFILHTSYFILLFAVLLFTKSRSGLLGFSLGLGIFSLLTLIKSKFSKPTSIVLLAVYCLLSTVYLFYGRGIVPQIDSHINTLFKTRTVMQPVNQLSSQPVNQSGTQLENGGSESGDIRRIVWTGALDLWKEYPLFGSGVETFAYAYYQTRPADHNLVSEWDFLYNKAHNEFLNFLSTTGLFGLVSYLSIMLVYSTWSLKHIFHLTRSLNSQERVSHPERTKRDVTSLEDAGSLYLIIALLSGFWALAVSNFFGFSTVSVALLFFLFPAIAFLITQKSPDTRYQIPENISSITWLLSGFWLLVTGYLLSQVYVMLRADRLYAQGKKAAASDTALAQGIQYLQQAVQAQPNQAVFTDELSLALSKGAVSLALSGQASGAAQFAQQAQTYSDLTLKLNPNNPNFYKTQARVYAYLAAVDNRYIALSQKSLEDAVKLAPTDAKLYYNLGLLFDQTGDADNALKLYQKTLDLKPNYEAARQAYGLILESQGETQKAIDQYQYILDRINPNNKLAPERIASLSANIQ